MICVIADDLSGAAELAGVGLRYGLSAEVQVEFHPASVADLICVDTDSRSCTVEEAARRVARVAEACREAGIHKIFKKVDSVLRGQVVAEMEALIEGLGRKRGLVVPANPALGRVIRDGVYLIDGVPLHQTGFAHDPEHPVRSADVLDLLASSPGQAVRILPSGGSLAPRGIQVGEATSPADLSLWASKLDRDTTPAGAAEFFAAFLAETGLQLKPSVGRLGSCASNDRALFVCGSVSEHSRAFCRDWRERGWPLLRMPAGLFEGGSQQNRLLENWANESVLALQQHRRVMVAIDRPLCRQPGMPERLSRHLGAVVQRILEWEPIDCIFAEGGATAAALVRQLGWQQLSARQELNPGVVCMRAVSGIGPWLTMKPGSYAWPAQIVNLGDPVSHR